MENLFASFAAFFVVALLAAMVPGVDTALVTKNAFGRGAGAALLTAAGCSTGQLFWGAASALGVAAILAASATAYSFVKLAGAAYLVYLGFRSLLAALSRERPSDAPEDGGDRGSPGGAPRASYAEGLVTNLLNPKTALFFSSLVPQFVSPGDPNWLFAVLTALTAATSFLWLWASSRCYCAPWGRFWGVPAPAGCSTASWARCSSPSACAWRSLADDGSAASALKGLDVGEQHLLQGHRTGRAPRRVHLEFWGLEPLGVVEREEPRAAHLLRLAGLPRELYRVAVPFRENRTLRACQGPATGRDIFSVRGF